MGKEDNIRNEAFQWARAKAFNSNKTSIGRAIAFGCATRCHLSEQIELQAKLLNYFLGSNKSNINQNVHSLALPRPFSGDDSRGGGTVTGFPGGG